MSCALTPIRVAIYALASISFCLFQYFSVPDVWKLDLWNTCIHCPGVHGHAKGNASDTHVLCCQLVLSTSSSRFSLCLHALACPGHTLLDVDQPLCHMGVTAFLCHLLPPVGRHHLVRPVLLYT